MSYVSPLHKLQTQVPTKAVFYGVLLTFLYRGNTKSIMENVQNQNIVKFYEETEVAELYTGKERSASVAIDDMKVIIKDSDQNSLVLDLEEAAMFHYGLQMIIQKTDAVNNSV